MGFYRRRHPERSDYYRLLESGFEAFARNWPEDFESRYGFLRKEVQGAVFAFLECGIPENGVARVRCPGCGHDFFVAFSCRTRVVCPSCTTRRSLLFGEKVREIVHPLNYRQVTFTIPKRMPFIQCPWWKVVIIPVKKAARPCPDDAICPGKQILRGEGSE